VMLALQPSGRHYARALQRATDYLHRVQGADGLWRTWQSYDDEPAKDCVAHIVSALSARHRGGALDLTRARRWLVEQATAPVADPERWRAVWFRSVPYGVLEITRALGASSALSLSAVRMLARHQNADGGFGATPGGPSTAGDTGLAVAALLQGDDSMGPTVLRGLQYIVDAQTSDGTWASTPSMVGPRPLLIDMPTNSHAFAAHGLSAAASSVMNRNAALRGRPLTEVNASLSR
jgi:squalene-hopene/tetraprenyl-beta-curcumene cyclase